MISIKRVYEKPQKSDGLRVLVDRLWPRGVSKKEAEIDLWLKEIAPSNELRDWFSHDPKKWEEFQKKYRAELKSKSDQINQISQKSESGQVTLVYAAKDIEHNNAVVLEKYLTRKD